MVLTSGGSLLEWWTIANYQILSTKSQDIRCRVSSVRKKKQVSSAGGGLVIVIYLLFGICYLGFFVTPNLFQKENNHE